MAKEQKLTIYRTSVDTCTGNRDLPHSHTRMSIVLFGQPNTYAQPLHPATLTLEKNWWVLWVVGKLSACSHPEVCSLRSLGHSLRCFGRWFRQIWGCSLSVVCPGFGRSADGQPEESVTTPPQPLPSLDPSCSLSLGACPPIFGKWQATCLQTVQSFLLSSLLSTPSFSSSSGVQTRSDHHIPTPLPAR